MSRNRPVCETSCSGAILAAILILPLLAIAQDEAELARETEKPLADLITVPLQHNWDFGIGPLKR